MREKVAQIDTFHTQFTTYLHVQILLLDRLMRIIVRNWKLIHNHYLVWMR
jgi:hypothetical protein